LISIVNYELGNVRSIANAFCLLGEEIEITDEPKKLAESEAIILPGVGSFSKGMENLKEKGLIDVLKQEVIEKKKPYLGICLGLEFLAEKSFEGGVTEGFGWIKGTIEKIDTKDSSLKIPHIGWNDSKILRTGGLYKEIKDPTFYYLHSYYFKVDKLEQNTITSVCDYGEVPITASVQKDNIYAVQFHPEKSQSVGIKLLKNFLNDIRDVKK
jgi:glutamine amidotransferase